MKSNEIDKYNNKQSDCYGVTSYTTKESIESARKWKEENDAALAKELEELAKKSKSENNEDDKGENKE
ncbi:hypothetical protein [Phocaeicola salanitronis]|jgi:hypothetical protein|uniref:hypothetical protein n=1 Tax=Phocaeicola salanitronis TaxID=376805 RepID=UPI00320A3AE7